MCFWRSARQDADGQKVPTVVSSSLLALSRLPVSEMIINKQLFLLLKFRFNLSQRDLLTSTHLHRHLFSPFHSVYFSPYFRKECHTVRFCCLCSDDQPTCWPVSPPATLSVSLVSDLRTSTGCRSSWQKL